MDDTHIRGGGFDGQGGIKEFAPFFPLIILNYSIILHCLLFFGVLAFVHFLSPFLGTRAACFPLSILRFFFSFLSFSSFILVEFLQLYYIKTKDAAQKKTGGWKRSGRTRQINQGCLEYICTEQQDLNKLPRGSKIQTIANFSHEAGLDGGVDTSRIPTSIGCSWFEQLFF